MEKRYLGVFFGVMMLVLGLSAAISYIGDPGGVFGHDTYEREMVDILQSGHNMINNDNMDWGRFRSTLITSDFMRPDTVVLGSSRVMEISNEMLDVLPLPKNRIFYNSWTSSATLGDVISLVMCYEEKGVTPSTIILGVEPHFFYKEGLFSPPLAKYYSIGLKQIGDSPSDQDKYPLLDKKYYELISYPYVIASMEKILRGDSHPKPTDEIFGENWIDLPDGRRSWPTSYREKTGAKVESETRTSQPSIRTTGRPLQMNKKQTRLFDMFSRYLLKRGVRVIFFLAPWHPIRYQSITNDASIYHSFTTDPGNRVLVESEDYIRKYAKENNIPVIGSFNPDLYSLISSDFYDGAHPRADPIARIFAIGAIGTREKSLTRQEVN